MDNFEQLIDTLLMQIESPVNQAKRNLPAPNNSEMQFLDTQIPKCDFLRWTRVKLETD